MLKPSTLFAAPAAMLLAAILPIAILAAAAAVAAGEGPPVSGAVEDFSRIDPPLPAPADSFKDANGDQLKLADFRGKVVLLNIWATWCGPCRFEMPSLDHVQAQLGEDGLKILPLSADRGGGPAVAMYYYQQGIDHLGIYLDVGGAFQDRLRVQALPTTFIIDRQGRMVGKLEGAIDWSSAEAVALLRYYLKAPGAPEAKPATVVPTAYRGPVQRVGTGLSPL